MAADSTGVQLIIKWHLLSSAVPYRGASKGPSSSSRPLHNKNTVGRIILQTLMFPF